MEALEIARFRVSPEREVEMQEKRETAVEALRRECPGLVSAQLARLDDRTWLDLFVWTSREAAEAAAARAPEIPEAAAYFATLAEVLTMEHADLVL